MSRKGKRTISKPSAVEVVLAGGVVTVKGPKGELQQSVDSIVSLEVDSESVNVLVEGQSRKSRAIHGLYWSLINNMIIGVSDGFSKHLEINGVGYRVQLQGRDLQFSMGYSHPVSIKAPEGVTFETKEPTKLTVLGIDKQKVGQVCAKIKRIRKIDPYKGKGIKFVDEIIRRKAGKSVK